MIYRPQEDVPETHQVRHLFWTLAERGMSQLTPSDQQVVQYLADLLTEFIHVGNLKRIANVSGERLEYFSEMLGEAMRQVPPEVRRAHFKHIGDVALFELGMFPERLTHGRRSVSPAFYAAQGRRSYILAAELEYGRETAVLRKLSNQFETCVSTLNWVRTYTHDPFLQYMLREYDVT
jgi:hypothetical protein